MGISVIISNFNGARYLPKLFESLGAQKDVELQIIVVDRQSTDESHRILAEHPEVEVVVEPPESGLVAGYSVGVPHARHDKFFFCNEDMWFSQDCLSLVDLQFAAGERIGAVMPIQRTYDGSALVNWGTWFRSDLGFRGTPNPFRASVFRELRAAEIISGINAGACMVSREAYETVGGWDTSFFLDYEDMDLSLRLWQHGYLCRVEPRAIAYHAVGASNAQRIENGRTMVGRKRYVGALSNQAVIALKSFSTAATIAGAGLILDRTLRDVLKQRWENVTLDLSATWLTLRRLPAVLRHRRVNRAVNRERPGQSYFGDPRFDLVKAPRAG